MSIGESKVKIGLHRKPYPYTLKVLRRVRGKIRVTKGKLYYALMSIVRSKG